jgi:acetylornithine deacetylase/succinyl-diaminopimelate desuccinylase-like protein
VAVQDPPLKILRRLISINSVFPNEQEIAKYCKNYLEDCGFEAKLQEFAPGRYNVVAQKGPRKGSVLLCGHLDTVPPYNYGDRDPFELQMKAGRIYGLGAWDMKAGLVLILACAKQCKPEGRGLRIVLTADEENISEGSWFAQKKGEFSGCSIAIVHEIPDYTGYIEAEKRPPILLGRRGRVIYRFTVYGIGSHGAGSGGVSAVSLGMQLAHELETVQMPSEKTGPCRLFIRRFSSESRSLSVPTEAIIEADVHYVPPYTPKTFMEYLQASLRRKIAFPAGCRWEVEIPTRKTPYLPAYETDLHNSTVQKFLSAYELHFGSCAVSYGLTVADENILSVEKMPIITLGAMGGGAHSSQEWVSEKDFLLLCDKVPRVVQEMLE